MTRKEAVAQVAARTGFTEKDIDQIVCAFLNVILETVNAGGRVELRYFGVFHLSPKRGRMGFRPTKLTKHEES